MAEHVWTVLCQQVIQNAQTNNVSMIEALERLTLTRDPGHEATDNNVGFELRATAVSLYMRSNPEREETFEARTRILGPEGEELVSVRTAIGMKKLRHRQMGNLQGWPFVGPGVYRYEVSIRAPKKRWRVVASLPVEIAVSPKDDEPA